MPVVPKVHISLLLCIQKVVLLIFLEPVVVYRRRKVIRVSSHTVSIFYHGLSDYVIEIRIQYHRSDRIEGAVNLYRLIIYICTAVGHYYTWTFYFRRTAEINSGLLVSYTAPVPQIYGIRCTVIIFVSNDLSAIDPEYSVPFHTKTRMICHIYGAVSRYRGIVADHHAVIYFNLSAFDVDSRGHTSDSCGIVFYYPAVEDHLASSVGHYP